MNYTIIQNEHYLKEFIDWLPTLDSNEAYYICLFARSKYSNITHISSDNQHQLQEHVCNKEKLFNKIKQMEITNDCYYGKHSEIPINQEALALYITPNPRNLKKASKNLAIKLIEQLDTDCNFNPVQLAISSVHTAKSNTRLVLFDFDIPRDVYDFITNPNLNIKNKKINDFIDLVLKILPLDCLSLIETRGGCHLCVHLEKIPKNLKSNWYNEIKNIEGIDVCGDSMIPIVGTYQGGFMPRFLIKNGYVTLNYFIKYNLNISNRLKYE